MVDALEERALVSLFELTVRDPLTRAYNRRYLMPHLRSELSFAARQGMSLAVLIVDIDFFKRVNDAHGHAVGDAVLQLVANTIQRLLRPYDVLCRYGGEEFVVVARDTSLRNAEILAQRIRNHVENVRFDVDGGTDAVTVSVGVTAVAPQTGSEDADALLIAADDALYVAKEAGRNRVRTSVVPQTSSAPGSTRRAFTAPPAAGTAEALAFELNSSELSQVH
jgi:diguanylate cyclase (GGDEF)-like protein